MPHLVQLFETTIISSDYTFAVRVITVPGGALKNQSVLWNPHILLNHLELQEHGKVDSPSLLPKFLAAASSAATIEPGASMPEFLERGAIAAELTRANIDIMCDEAAFTPLIPFQESPLDLHSLAELAVKATGVSLGAYAGFVASGGTPLVLITVPAGMVLAGAAAGIGKALEEGLRRKILTLMGVPDKPSKLEKEHVQSETEHVQSEKRSFRLDK